ncbi:hypothetical protein ACFO4E_12870 [Nocardiopsis mangrovi]|uniref:Uncharacterized protein n=1 Tax=Nocardiopsis mangrovi TaxID=1179818 RepID=A0ABV9DVF2_9ACTN
MRLQRSAYWTPPLSITLGSLPRRTPFILAKRPGGYLIVISDGITFGELEHAYMNTLRGPVRGLLYAACGVPDPAIDPDGYERARWWDLDQVVDWETIAGLEELGRIARWPHRC